MVIAVSGKGGTGKSTLAALIVRECIRRMGRPVLAVDADPNSTLGGKLGLEAECTIGDLREDALIHKHDASAGTPKQVCIQYGVQNAIAEGNGFDLVVMGRGEGPGCYCSVNNMLRTFLHEVSSGYKHTVIDNEAGMEHLSRRTDDKVDLMFVVSDATPTGLRSARRIAQLADELEVVRGRMGLLVNRVTDPERAREDAAAFTGLEVLGFIPEDPLVQEYELQCKPVIALPDESKAAAAVTSLFATIGILVPSIPV